MVSEEAIMILSFLLPLIVMSTVFNQFMILIFLDFLVVNMFIWSKTRNFGEILVT